MERVQANVTVTSHVGINPRGVPLTSKCKSSHVWHWNVYIMIQLPGY